MRLVLISACRSGRFSFCVGIVSRVGGFLERCVARDGGNFRREPDLRIQEGIDAVEELAWLVHFRDAGWRAESGSDQRLKLLIDVDRFLGKLPHADSGDLQRNADVLVCSIMALERLQEVD